MNKTNVSYERVTSSINSVLKDIQSGRNKLKRLPSGHYPKSTIAVFVRMSRLLLQWVDFHYKYEASPEERRKAYQHRRQAVAAVRELREAVTTTNKEKKQ